MESGDDGQGMRGMLAVAVAVCLVSVAYGLLVGPSGTQVAFPTTIAAHSAAPADLAPVSVQVTQGAVGRTTSATLERGGQAAGRRRPLIAYCCRAWLRRSSQWKRPITTAITTSPSMIPQNDQPDQPITAMARTTRIASSTHEKARRSFMPGEYAARTLSTRVCGEGCGAARRR